MYGINIYNMKHWGCLIIGALGKGVTERTINRQIIEKEKKELEDIKESLLKFQDYLLINLSHELKTPLNVIFSANQMMDMYLQQDSMDQCKQKLVDYNRSINKNCYRQLKLINNMMDMAKFNTGLLTLNLKNIDIVDTFKNTIQLVLSYVEDKGLNLYFHTNTDKKIIACDTEKLDKIMFNLISNAIKNTDKGGSIYINLIDKNHVVEISVKDTGTGIDKEHQEMIFDRFYKVDKTLSRCAEGNGIGLTLVKNFVELHKGIISVESEVGKGSIFTFQLPVITALNPSSEIYDKCLNNKTEIIKIEFSDIYD